MLPQEVDPPRTKYSKKRQKQQQQKQQHENATVTVKSLGAVLITDTGVRSFGGEISAHSISRTCPEAIHFYYHCKKRKGENKTLCSFRLSLPACSPTCIKSSFSSSMLGQWKSFFSEGPPEVQKNKPDFTFMFTFQLFLFPLFKKKKRKGHL